MPPGRPRSPASLPGYHAGRSPRNRGQRYPADPPTVAEIVAVMRHAGTDVYGVPLRALIVVLWRAGLRIREALALGESELDERRGRCSCAAAGAPAGGRSAWTSRCGSSFNPGSPRAVTYRSVRSSASPPRRHAGGCGQPAPHAPSDEPPLRPAGRSAAALEAPGLSVEIQLAEDRLDRGLAPTVEREAIVL